MGCLEFWVVNSFLAGMAFFILFLVVDTQYPLYPYGVAGTPDEPDKKASATSCIIAACIYLLIGVGLLLWKMSRDKRIQQSQDYPRVTGPIQQQSSLRGRSIEL